jgi:cellulose biosynthesis protein BcsQ
MKKYPYVITISSEKGGVGKTTLATNLAIFLKALDEELPVSIFSFDNHFTIDKMFAFKGEKNRGTVADLLRGVAGSDLLQTGQYGVSYIPSSPDLTELKECAKGPMALARLLATSGITGIIIIDTRPDLDNLTQNALYGADRVLIPVKDMPSLENCRNIFALFDKRGLDKKSLSLIPCLIDERIKFDGLFADQKTLLRAFAINRGYRCQDVYISKSPKVESLNTNPDGKIYPVLTHGRGTDVHGQFLQLSRVLLDEYQQTAEPRAYLFQQWLASENSRKKEEYFARLTGLKQECLYCNSQLAPDATSATSYYYESSDGSAKGYLHGECFFRLLAESIYNLKPDMAEDDPTLLLLKESARESTFSFRPRRGEQATQVEFRRFDQGGMPVTNRLFPFREHAGGMFYGDKCPLFTLMSATLAGYGDSFRDEFLVVHPIPTNNPGTILQDEQYRSFTRLKNRIAGLLT